MIEGEGGLVGVSTRRRGPPLSEEFSKGVSARKVTLKPNDKRYKPDKKPRPPYLKIEERKRLGLPILPKVKKTLESYINVRTVGNQRSKQPPRDLKSSGPDFVKGRYGNWSKLTIEQRNERDKRIAEYRKAYYKKHPKKAPPIPTKTKVGTRPLSKRLKRLQPVDYQDISDDELYPVIKKKKKHLVPSRVSRKENEPHHSSSEPPPQAIQPEPTEPVKVPVVSEPVIVDPGAVKNPTENSIESIDQQVPSPPSPPQDLCLLEDMEQEELPPPPPPRVNIISMPESTPPVRNKLRRHRRQRQEQSLISSSPTYSTIIEENSFNYTLEITVQQNQKNEGHDLEPTFDLLPQDFNDSTNADKNVKHCQDEEKEKEEQEKDENKCKNVELIPPPKHTTRFKKITFSKEYLTTLGTARTIKIPNKSISQKGQEFSTIVNSEEKLFQTQVEAVSQQLLDWQRDRHLEESFTLNPLYLPWYHYNIRTNTRGGGKEDDCDLVIQEEILTAIKTFNNKQRPLFFENQQVLESARSVNFFLQNKGTEALILALYQTCFPLGPALDLQEFTNYLKGLTTTLPTTNNTVFDPKIEQVKELFFKIFTENFLFCSMPAPQFPHFVQPVNPKPNLDQITAKGVELVGLPSKNWLGDSKYYWSVKQWAEERRNKIFGVVNGTINVRCLDMVSIRPGGSLTDTTVEAIISIMTTTTTFESEKVFVLRPSVAQALLNSEADYLLKVNDIRKEIQESKPKLHKIVFPLHLGAQENEEGGGTFVAAVINVKKHLLTVFNPSYKEGHLIAKPRASDKANFNELLEKLKLIAKFAQQFLKGKNSIHLPLTFHFPDPPFKVQRSKKGGGILLVLFIERLLRGRKNFSKSRKPPKPKKKKDLPLQKLKKGPNLLRLIKQGDLHMERLGYFIMLRDSIIDQGKGAKVADEPTYMD